MSLQFFITIYTTLLFTKGLCLVQKKHVILIVADDLGWNDISFHGSDQYQTPNIDALAYNGIILNNYYTLPVCTPSRSALMTGIHPIHTGMYRGVINSGKPYGLPLNYTILPQYLKKYGYKTRAVGKWHLGFHKKVYTPMYRGFDSHFGYWGGREDYYTHIQAYSPFCSGRDFRRGVNTTWNYDGQYTTDLFTEESINIINAHNVSNPLFLYLAHLVSHAANENNPLQAPAEIVEKFNYIKDEKRRILAAMIWKLDESVGKVVEALASNNMLNDTIIIFTTDNGGSVLQNGGGNCASNWPLRGAKATLWEGGVRGTSFIWSADLPHSKVSNALMHIQDWLPTILGAVDNNFNSTISLEGLDGHNMWPVLNGNKDSEYDELIIQRDLKIGVSALRKNNWKIIKGYRGPNHWYGPSGRSTYPGYNISGIQHNLVTTALSNNNVAIILSEETILQLRANVTLSCNYCEDQDSNCTPCVTSKNEICLFDLSNDPCEKNNLAPRYPNLTTTLMNTMDKYIPVKALNKPFDPRSNPIFWNNTWVNWLDYINDTTTFRHNFNHIQQSMIIIPDELIHKDLDGTSRTGLNT